MGPAAAVHITFLGSSVQMEKSRSLLTSYDLSMPTAFFPEC